jgi:hypothetical protein
MLWTLGMVLFSLWLVAITTPATLNGHVHFLLLTAVVAMLLRLIPRKNLID